jgi:hypothetical protein
MSVRADRLVRGTRHIAYFRKAGRPGHARRIAADLLRPDVVEIAMEYPVTTEIRSATRATTPAWRRSMPIARSAWPIWPAQATWSCCARAIRSSTARSCTCTAA